MQLKQRLEHLPLILAGPILRRTESNAVTVWLALKASREVTLKIYATSAKGSIIEAVLLKGTASTVPLGKHLHIVAVTAKSSFSLKPGEIYAYDLSFSSSEQNLTQALNSETIFPKVTVSYFQHQLPTFALPPEDLNNLRIAHGSCRKLHGGGQDALQMLDELISHYATEPNNRLHQLFFTGDQIYGDDVADVLLWTATQIGDTLLGWEENLPFYQTSSKDYEYRKPCELKPGDRTDISRDYAGLTAMLIDTPEESKSHLFSLAEYYTTYLLVWSPILWHLPLPQGKDIHQDSKQAKLWDKETRILEDCISQLWKVRRAMANVPIYMICDDHDISDDWFLNRAWCNQVLGNPLGRRIVQNGMLAYAVFQAWGNTPQQFEEGQPGGNLLKAAVIWSASGGNDEIACEDIAKFLGLPQIAPQTNLPKYKLDGDVLILDRDYPDGAISLEWNYTVRSLKHEVIVLDTRTWRGYPLGEGEVETGRGGDEEAGGEYYQLPITNYPIPNPKSINQHIIAPPRLLSPTAFQKQIQQPLEITDNLKQTGKSEIEVTFVVLPTNLVSLRIIDIVQRCELEQGNVFKSDVGDAWNLNEVALSKLLAELFKRRQYVIVLSGDIHYAGAIRLSYWFNRHFEAESQSVYKDYNKQNYQARVLAQLTASAFKNSEIKTYFIHTKAKTLLPETSQDWVGWNEPPELVEIQVTPGMVRIVDVPIPNTRPVVRQVLGARGNYDIVWEIAIKNSKSLPDWQYHIDWIRRQKATAVPWKASHQNKQTGLLSTVGNIVSMIWRNKWFQEGKEVIGHSNFGLITLVWHDNKKEANAVIQDIYWRPTWKADTIVYSRYFVPLQIEQPPPPLTVI
jgi:hypothetical protein